MSTEFFNDQWRIPSNENQNKVSNYSMSFDGSSDFIDLGTSLNSKLELGDSFSISAWVNFNNTSSDRVIISNLSNSIRGFHLRVKSDDSIRFIMLQTNAIYLFVDSSSISTDTWHHIVCTYDGSGTIAGLNLYINSSLDNNNTVAQGTISTTTSTDSLRIAKDFSNTPKYFNGEIDQVSIFDYALPATGTNSVATLYGGGTAVTNPMSLLPKPIYYTQLGEQSVDNGANYLVPNNSLGGYVFNFDSANNEYIDLGTTPFSFTQNLTVSFWVKTSQTALNSLIGKDSNVVTNGRNWMIYQNNDKINFWTTSAGSTSSPPLSITTSNTSINDNQWHHIVCINDYVNSTRQIYIDNVLDITDNNGTAISTSSTSVRIGSRDISTGYPYDGLMSNVALWSTALTASQVETIYNNGTPNDISSLSPLSWYKLNEDETYNGTDWNINDYGSGGNDGTSVSMDSSDLVLSNLTTGTSGYSPYTLNLDSANQNSFDCGNDNSLQATTVLSISAWVRFTSGSSTYRFGVASRFDTSSNINYGLILNQGTGTRTARIFSGSNILNSTKTIDINKWSHIAATVDSNGATIYINGVASGTNSSFTINSVADADFYIGYSQFFNSFFPGEISNVAVWNSTALTSTEITEIYNLGVPSNLHTFSGAAPTSWWQIGSNSSFNSSTWTCLDETGTNNAVSSANMTNDDITNGVGYSGNALGTSSIEIANDAPYSTANGLSENMDVLDRTTDVPS
jgi:hypothetical protein